MVGKSKIEWTERSDWNCIRGCTRKSRGCKFCYAEAIAGRFSDPGQPFHGFASRTSAGGRWSGKVEVVWERLLLPLSWRKPAMIFGSSTSDLFHEALPADQIASIYAVGIAAHHLRGHTIQWLTKRPERAHELLNDRTWWEMVNSHAEALVMERVDPLDRRSDDARATLEEYGPWNPPPGVWLGTSVEDQATRSRLIDLAQTPAAVRFVSGEPLLEGVDFTDIPLNGGVDENGIQWLFNALTGEQYFRGDDGYTYNGDGPDMAALNWVIVGGESGRGARPMHPDWVHSLRDQCAVASVPFFFKQWGEWAPVCEIGETDGLYHPAPETRPEASRRCKVDSCVLHKDGARFDGEAMYSKGAFWQGTRAMTMFKVGKADAGRLLMGIEHNGIPSPAS